MAKTDMKTDMLEMMVSWALRGETPEEAFDTLMTSCLSYRSVMPNGAEHWEKAIADFDARQAKIDAEKAVQAKASE